MSWLKSFKRFILIICRKKEDIPNEDDLYHRLHPNWYDDKRGKISSGAFTSSELSVDWSRYSTPKKTARKYQWIAAFQAKIPRQKGLEVIHDPTLIYLNYAHSLVLGKKTKKVRRLLAKSCRAIEIN